jgi:hypothetical protein
MRTKHKLEYEERIWKWKRERRRHSDQLLTDLSMGADPGPQIDCFGVEYVITDQLLIRFSAFVRYWRKNGSTMRQYISYS